MSDINLIDGDRRWDEFDLLAHLAGAVRAVDDPANLAVALAVDQVITNYAGGDENGTYQRLVLAAVILLASIEDGDISDDASLALVERARARYRVLADADPKDPW